MLKGRELMGLPVVNLQSGKEIGTVEDLHLDLVQGRVKALSVRSGGWLTACRPVPLMKICKVGTDAVLIEDGDFEDLKDSLSESDRKMTVCGIKSLKGLQVLGAEGKDLGTIEDVVLGLPEGKIAGWEISDGLVQDLVEGRRVLPLGSVITYGPDRFIAQEGGW